jgi:hypothetical protein
MMAVVLGGLQGKRKGRRGVGSARVEEWDATRVFAASRGSFRATLADPPNPVKPANFWSFAVWGKKWQ